MKRSPFSVPSLSCLATAACLLLQPPSATADEPYRVDTHGPRIGTRILYFFKDLAYGDNPNDRYRHLQGPPPPSARHQHNPGAYQSSDRYSLDQPPPVNGMVPRRQPMSFQQPQDTAARDLPYVSDTPPAPPTKNRTTTQTSVGSQKEEIPPVTIKPKSTPAHKSSTPSQPLVRHTPPAPATPKKSQPEETRTADLNSASSTKKPWQSFGGDTGRGTQTTVESKPSPPPPPSSSGSTLTGTKTTKEGRVKSPHAPFNELDVTGLPAGSLAMDPTTGKVFRVP